MILKYFCRKKNNQSELIKGFFEKLLKFNVKPEKNFLLLGKVNKA